MTSQSTVCRPTAEEVLFGVLHLAVNKSLQKQGLGDRRQELAKELAQMHLLLISCTPFWPQYSSLTNTKFAHPWFQQKDDEEQHARISQTWR